MDGSIFEKFKPNLIALLVGAIASASAVWNVADNLHKREIGILERQNADIQKRVIEVEAQLKLARQERCAPAAAVADAGRSRKRELEALIRTLEAEIVAKKEELRRHAPVVVGGEKDDSYLEVESELHSLQAQRDEAKRQLIRVVGGGDPAAK